MKKILIIITLIIFIFSGDVFAESMHNDLLNAKEKIYLLNLSRQTIIWYLKYRAIPEPAKGDLSVNVLQGLGCFVTLNHNTKGLRGCIGIFERDQPLYKNVISRAIAASTKDSRFKSDPVTYKEMKDIKIEISVLTEPQYLTFKSPEDLLSKLRPNIDGVIIYTEYGESTYLPQVWEYYPKKEDFLSHLCEKHGAPRDTWLKDYKNIKVQTYQALVFGEESSNRYVIGPKGATVGKKGAMVLEAVSPLKEGTEYGGGPLNEGTQLAPGAIVTWDSDIIEAR
jgi:uncharacterized protein